MAASLPKKKGSTRTAQSAPKKKKVKYTSKKVVNGVTRYFYD
jgi:hypothetical protein